MDEAGYPEDLAGGVGDYPEKLLVVSGQVMIGEDITEQTGVAVHAERGDAVSLLPAAEGEGSDGDGGVKVGDVRITAWSGFGDRNLLDGPLDGTRR